LFTVDFGPWKLSGDAVFFVIDKSGELEESGELNRVKFDLAKSLSETREASDSP
jgi:hypothetical protein